MDLLLYKHGREVKNSFNKGHAPTNSLTNEEKREKELDRLVEYIDAVKRILPHCPAIGEIYIRKYLRKKIHGLLVAHHSTISNEMGNTEPERFGFADAVMICSLGIKGNVVIPDLQNVIREYYKGNLN